MANGQLGAGNEGIQLATTPVSSGGATKDRQYFGPMVSIAGETNPPSWDRYLLWGITQDYSIVGASAFVPNRLLAIPMWFSRTGRIKTVNNLVSTNIGFPATYVLGIYNNKIDGGTYPGNLLVQSTEFALNTGGSATPLNWNPDLPVTAGSLLWLVASAGGNNVLPSVGIDCADMPGLMGTAGKGGAFASATDWDLICGFRVSSTYGAALPSPFPVTGTFGLYGHSQPAGLTTMPVFGVRYAKT